MTSRPLNGSLDPKGKKGFGFFVWLRINLLRLFNVKATLGEKRPWVWTPSSIAGGRGSYFSYGYLSQSERNSTIVMEVAVVFMEVPVV